jgi:type I restriction enzyme R subunit
VLEDLADVTKMYDADRFDLLCHVSFSSPLRTRRERAELLLKGKKDFFEQYSYTAREILNEILNKYIEFGTEQFQIPDILNVSPIDKHGNVMEIAKAFGGEENLRNAVIRMQNLLYGD